MIKMYNKEQVINIIKTNESVYFTSEQGVQASKNALDSLKNVTTLDNPVVKYLGNYDGEDFTFEDYEICDGDSIYILTEA